MSCEKSKHLIFYIVVLSAMFTTVSAQSSSNSEPPWEYPEAVKQYLKGLYAEQQQQYTFRCDYPGGFEAWQAKARPELSRLIGLNTIAAYVGIHQVKVRLLEKKDRGSHTLQKGFIETEPHIEIPLWLLIPKGKGPFPLAVLPHGHDRRGHDTHAAVYHDQKHRQKTIAGDRDVAVQAVENGFLAIAPAVRGLAEEAPAVPDVRERHGDRDCRSQFMHCLLAGRTAIGERVWDMMRIIDWAAELPEVDASTILMMGNSGGGMVTLYSGACDKRITIAVPSCSFSVLNSPEGYIYHCDCNAVPGILQWGNLYDVAGLIAPRYLLTVNGLKDKLHSVDDINRAASRVQAIYQAAGVAENYEHRWGAEGHRFYKDLMWPFILVALDKK
jgi:dienelactone hydrolase